MNRSLSALLLGITIVIGLASTARLGAQGKEAKKTELAVEKWGTLKGKVLLQGEIPKPGDFTPAMKKHQDAKCCLDGVPAETVNPTWIVDAKTRGVANVVVYLAPPEGTYFPVRKENRQRKKKVEIDQPHCAFLPHIVALFPEYFDGEKFVLTGESCLIKNSAPVTHNARAIGNPELNPGFNTSLQLKESREHVFKPQRLPVLLQCNIHSWMSAQIHVFDHPYFAITKEDGTYEIANVPVGVELRVMGYHEGVGYVLGKAGRTMTMEEKVNTFDFKVKAP